MATTPQEYLPLLTKKLDARQERIRLLRRYSNGDAPMPEMGRNTKASWEAFQKKARTDLGGLTCASLAGRMVPNGVRVGETADNPGVAAARRVWRDNRLDVVFADAIWDMLSVSVSYLITGVRTGDPIITAEKPEQVVTIGDPAQPWRSVAALKAWRDLDAGNDYALVWVDGVRQKFVRQSTDVRQVPLEMTSGEWVPAGVEPYAGSVPVFALENFNSVAEFEPHIDVIDRINMGKLNRLVVTAHQAFKARALKGLPDKDENGNDIDWGKRLSFAPGALVDLPEGIDVWESEAVDIRPLLEGEKADARDFSAVTRTPLDVFIPSGENQSATGAANAHKGEIQKAKDRTARASAPMEGAILSALRVLGLDDGSTVQMLWQPPEHISFSEKTLAASQAIAAGMSKRWIAQNIMGMSPEEISQNAEDAADELLQNFALTGAPSGNTNP